MLKLAMIFNDKMVLQQKKPIRIWGTADPGAVIVVKLDNTTATTLTDFEGNWLAELPKRDAATGMTVTVSDGMENLIYTDVCIGEVWLAGGQSNMEFQLGFEQHYEGELEDREYIHEGFWRECKSEDLKYYSAVGYYFAKNLQMDLQIPIGMIGCNWGGTPACAWMNPEYLKGTDGEVWLTEYEKASSAIDMETYLAEYKTNPINDRTELVENPVFEKLLKIGLTREEQLEFSQKMAGDLQEAPIFYERRPGGLYETMLKKIAPYAIRGVIWYQGETDGDYHPQEYTTVFSKMIANWRDLWKEELPFLYVQLAPFQQWMHVTGKNYGIIRKCQEEVSKTVPKVWMTTSGDAGMKWDIHAKNKKPVGERLALLARGHVYGESILCDAPEVLSVENKGSHLVIHFANAEGLHIQGELLHALQVKKDGQYIDDVETEVQEDCLILYHMADAEAIYFAQDDYYEVNLYNEADVPAKPFRVMR